MDQSPTARLAPAHASDGVHGRATHIGRVGDISFGFLVCPGAGGGGEKFLPTCVLCHVNRSTQVIDFPKHDFEILPQKGKCATESALPYVRCTWRKRTAAGRRGVSSPAL